MGLRIGTCTRANHHRSVYCSTLDDTQASVTTFGTTATALPAIEAGDRLRSSINMALDLFNVARASGQRAAVADIVASLRASQDRIAEVPTATCSRNTKALTRNWTSSQVLCACRGTMHAPIHTDRSARTHTHARTHARMHARTRARAHTQIQTHTLSLSLSLSLSLTHTHTHTHTGATGLRRRLECHVAWWS